MKTQNPTLATLYKLKSTGELTECFRFLWGRLNEYQIELDEFGKFKNADRILTEQQIKLILKTDFRKHFKMSHRLTDELIKQCWNRALDEAKNV